MRIRILASAKRDLIDGYRFYERQLEGLGEYFLDSLYSDIDSLLVSAGIHAVCFDRFQRLLSKRFPFSVYYQVAESSVNVYAILDSRRSPSWIRNRLRRHGRR